MRGITTGLLVLLLAAIGAASSVRELTFDERVASGERIFTGKVVSATCREGEGEKDFPIWTDFRFEVSAVLKGESATGITVSLAGGRIGDRAVRVAGMPRLRVGASYVIFHAPEAGGVCPIVGWGQGVFRLRTGEDALETHVETLAGRIVSAVRGGRIVLADPEPAEEDAEAPPPLGRSAFEEEIRTRVRRQEAEERERRAAEAAGGEGK